MKRELPLKKGGNYNALLINRQSSIITLIKKLINEDTFITSFQRSKLVLERCHSLRQTSIYILAFFCLIVFSGCASKPIVKIQTQKVYIPIKCNLKIPNKPLDDGSFQSHKDLAKYFLQVEQIAKDCVNGNK